MMNNNNNIKHDDDEDINPGDLTKARQTLGCCSEPTPESWYGSVILLVIPSGTILMFLELLPMPSNYEGAFVGGSWNASPEDKLLMVLWDDKIRYIPYWRAPKDRLASMYEDYHWFEKVSLHEKHEE